MCASWQHSGHHLYSVVLRYSIGPTVLQRKVTHRNKTDAACTSCRAETTERTSALILSANANNGQSEGPNTSHPNVTCDTNKFSFRNGGQPRIRPPTVTHKTPGATAPEPMLSLPLARNLASLLMPRQRSCLQHQYHRSYSPSGTRCRFDSAATLANSLLARFFNHSKAIDRHPRDRAQTEKRRFSHAVGTFLGRASSQLFVANIFLLLIAQRSC